MKTNQFNIAVIILALSLNISALGQQAGKIPVDVKREKVTDRIISVSNRISWEIPEIPSLCDEMGYKGKYINIGDCNLYVETRGEGIPMVVINGGPGGAHNKFHPFFARAEQFSEIIYYDQRGCGKSDYNPGKGYSVEQAVNDLESLRKQLNIDKWIVLGHSYGGFLAQYYTTLFPENVKGLVLVCAGTGLHSNELRYSREQKYISNAERARFRILRDSILLGESNRDISLEKLQLLVYNNHKDGDWKRQSYYKPDSLSLARSIKYAFLFDAENKFIETMNASKKTINLKGCFDNNPIPTLIIESLNDLTWNRDKAYILHENHPNAKMLVFSKSAHSPFMEEPDLFFSHLNCFVDTISEIKESELDRFKQSIRDKHDLYFDDNLDSPVSDSEKSRISHYKEILKNIEKGESYFDQSTPVDCHLSFISAAMQRDSLKMGKLSFKDWPMSRIEYYRNWLRELYIFRIPDFPKSPVDGELFPIYFSDSESGKRSRTFIFIYWNKLWYRCGNNPSTYGDWRENGDFFRNSFYRDAAKSAKECIK